jgi:hypothetical protein
MAKLEFGSSVLTCGYVDRSRGRVGSSAITTLARQRVRVRVERGEVSRRMFGKSTTGRRVCTRLATAAEDPLKSKQRATLPYCTSLAGHSAPNRSIELLRGCGGKRSQVQALKQGTREQLVDALGPSAPTPAATRHVHTQSMPPLAQRSLLRVLQLAQSALAASGCAAATLCLEVIDDRLRRGEIRPTNCPPLRVAYTAHEQRS